MTRRRLLRLLGLTLRLTLRFAAWFLRAARLVSLAIGLRLAFSLRLTRRFRAPLRIGARLFVTRPRFRIASVTLAFFPLARFTRVALRTVTSLTGLAVRAFSSITLPGLGFTRLAIACLTCVTLRSLTGGGFIGVARTRRGFFSLTCAPFA